MTSYIIAGILYCFFINFKDVRSRVDLFMLIIILNSAVIETIMLHLVWMLYQNLRDDEKGVKSRRWFIPLAILIFLTISGNIIIIVIVLIVD